MSRALTTLRADSLVQKNTNGWLLTSRGGEAALESAANIQRSVEESRRAALLGLSAASGPASVKDMMADLAKPDAAVQRMMDDLAKPNAAVQKMMDDLAKPKVAVQQMMDDLAKPKVAVQQMMDDFVKPSALVQKMMDDLAKPKVAVQQMMDGLTAPSSRRHWLLEDFVTRTAAVKLMPEYNEFLRRTVASLAMMPAYRDELAQTLAVLKTTTNFDERLRMFLSEMRTVPQAVPVCEAFVRDVAEVIEMPAVPETTPETSKRRRKRVIPPELTKEQFYAFVSLAAILMYVASSRQQASELADDLHVLALGLFLWLFNEGFKQRFHD